MYDEVAVILEKAPSIIADLQQYQGAGEQIREVSFLLMRTNIVNQNCERYVLRVVVV